MKTYNKKLLLSLVTLCSLFAGERAYGQLADWNRHAFPAGAAMQFEHSLAILQDGPDVYGYSCYTRNGAKVHTTGGSVIITKWNEHFIVQDGIYYHAYSARTGQFSTLAAFSVASALVPSTAAQTWLSAVQDGHTLHMYFSFTGAWQTFQFPNIAQVQLANFCALIHDGTWVWAVSAYYGNPVPLMAANAGTNGVFGTVATGSCAWNSSPNRVHYPLSLRASCRRRFQPTSERYMSILRRSSSKSTPC
jgi:hypothetical protein